MAASETLKLLAEPRVRDFLNATRIARLATADTGAVPHAVPVCFWFNGTRFYFAIDQKPKSRPGTELKRMRNIAANPRVALIIDHYEEDWAELAFVLVRGTAQLVEDNDEEYMLALRALRDKYQQYRAMELTPGTNPIVRIEPTHAHIWGARFGIGRGRGVPSS